MSSPAGKTSTQERVSPGEEETTKKGREDKSYGLESSVSKSQIDFSELEYSDEFKQWFWTENNAKNIILAVNNYFFKPIETGYVRYEECSPRIYGVGIDKGDPSDPFWKNIDELGLKLVKVGFTQKRGGNRMEEVENEIQKNGHFTTSQNFYLILDFTTAYTLLEEEQYIRRKVGIALDKELTEKLNLPITTEWVITKQAYIDSIKVEEVQYSKDQKVYTTMDVKPCDRQSIEELVKKIDALDIAVKDDKIVLLSKYKDEIQQKQYLTSSTGDAFLDGLNCESTTHELKFTDWDFRGDSLKDMIAALNDFSFNENEYEGPFVRLEKSPAQIYAVVINEDGQHKHPFWKELYRLGLKLVKIGFTQQETIKGSGNPMEIIQKRIKSELRFKSSLIFSLTIDFTAMTSFREVEEDIRSKVGIKLDEKFARWVKLPVPTDWVLTSQEILYSLTNRIQEKEEQCTSSKTIHTTKDTEPCDLQSIEKLVNKINLSYVRLKDGKMVLVRKKRF